MSVWLVGVMIRLKSRQELLSGLTLTDDGKVKRINLSGKKLDQTALPMQVTQFDFEDKLEITGLVLDETKTYDVDHDATIVEEDGTEVRIAPRDVQYQNASIWGRLITNFAGPMNNFILSIVVYSLLAFMRGGAIDYYSNNVRWHLMGRWLRSVSKAMFRSFKSTTILLVTGMS